MTYYNLTGMMEAQNVGLLARSTNDILGGYYYGLFTLIMVAFITFIYMKTKGVPTAGAWVSASWMLFIVSLFLRPLQLIDNYIFWSTIFIFVASVAILFMVNRAE